MYSETLLKDAVHGAQVFLHVVGVLEGLAAECAVGRLEEGVLHPDVARQIDARHHAQALRAARHS
jgi:hypothetical protein